MEALAAYALAKLHQMETRDDPSLTAYLGDMDLDKGIRELCFLGRVDPDTNAGVSDARGGVLLDLLQRVTRRSAALVAAWMASGFAHGVMNTDNMSLLGLTIDLKCAVGD